MSVAAPAIALDRVSKVFPAGVPAVRYEVAGKKRAPEEVAREFLKAQRLVR